MEILRLNSEFIRLGQALKAAGLLGNGVDDKFAVQYGLVTVDGETELRRGRKLYGGEIVEFQGEQIIIE